MTQVNKLVVVHAVCCDVISSGPAAKFQTSSTPKALESIMPTDVSPSNVKVNLCQLEVAVNGAFMDLFVPSVAKCLN